MMHSERLDEHATPERRVQPALRRLRSSAATGLSSTAIAGSRRGPPRAERMTGRGRTTGISKQTAGVQAEGNDSGVGVWW